MHAQTKPNTWIIIRPHSVADLGMLPMVFIASDPRPAAEQANERYAHGGGWHPQPGWSFDSSSGAAWYPGDETVTPIAVTTLRDEMILLYPHAYVAIVQKDGSFEMARMD